MQPKLKAGSNDAPIKVNVGESGLLGELQLLGKIRVVEPRETYNQGERGNKGEVQDFLPPYLGLDFLSCLVFSLHANEYEFETEHHNKKCDVVTDVPQKSMYHI
jgi:hypothetical protein